MLQPRIELGPKRWQRSILPLNYCSFTIPPHQKTYLNPKQYLLRVAIINRQYHCRYKWTKIKIQNFSNRGTVRTISLVLPTSLLITPPFIASISTLPSSPSMGDMCSFDTATKRDALLSLLHSPPLSINLSYLLEVSRTPQVPFNL